MTQRDNFPKAVIEILAKRGAQRCSNPQCNLLTSGPHSSSGKAVVIGVAAHISAASPGGRRYDPNMSPDERSSIENGIWLCQNCAKLIDSDETTFPVDLLKTWKREHEKLVHENILHSTKGVNVSLGVPHGLSSHHPIELGLTKGIQIQVTTNSEKLPVYSHISTSSSNPISVVFAVTNTLDTLIEYIQVHAWLLYGHLVRNPEVWESSLWKPQEIERLPVELTSLANFGTFNRYTLSLSPHDKFYMMPSQHPKYLPDFEIKWTTFLGMIPIPWQVEIPGLKPIFGILLLWVSERGIFSSESVHLNADWDNIEKRVNLIHSKYKPDKSDMIYTGIPRY